MDRPNLFIGMPNKDLKECYRSYCRIQCKREHKDEIMNPIVIEYQNYMSEKSAYAIAYADMFNEITRRWIKIMDGLNYFHDVIEMGDADEYLVEWNINKYEIGGHQRC